MFVPGNNPGMMQDAYIYNPDSIMLDLEDSVTMAEKDAARLLVYNALKTIDYGTTEMVVRINPLNTPYGKKDIEAVVKAGVDVIRMPKTETAEEVIEVEREIEKVEQELGCVGRTQIMAALESTLGVVNAYAIATASKRMMGIALGAEDYCANLKTQRSPEGMELLMARQTIVVAARAAGIDALDTVYSNLNDMETFRKEVELIHQLGFDGKSIINPRQIEIINEVFTPTQKAIDKALAVIAAIKEAEKKGSGVIAVNGKMVDRPVVIRAQRINPLNTPYGKKDIEAVVKAGVDVIRMPKTETAEEVIEVEREIEKVEQELGCVGRTQIMAALESTLGVVNAYAIATASKRMMGIALGAEDYCANLKTQRSPEGMELLMARQTIVVAARAAGIDALDTVYSNLNDMETFRKEVELIHQLGFDGKSIINPRQIEIINEVFTPTQKAIDKALAVIAAIKEAEKKGSGVIAVNGKMVDRPVVIRAQRIIDLALASGVIKQEDIA